MMSCSSILGVDLYVSDKELWVAIFSRVEKWNELRKDLTPSSSLQRAGRLLHMTKSGKFCYQLTKSCTEQQVEDALVEIERAIVKMFDQWKRPPSSAPVQLCFLLATAAECRAQEQEGILCLAVFSSPHFSDSEFTKILLNRLANIINFEDIDSEMEDLAMLCFCILCAIDRKPITLANSGNN